MQAAGPREPVPVGGLVLGEVVVFGVERVDAFTVDDFIVDAAVVVDNVDALNVEALTVDDLTVDAVDTRPQATCNTRDAKKLMKCGCAP